METVGFLLDDIKLFPVNSADTCIETVQLHEQ